MTGATKRKAISKKVRKEVYSLFEGHCAYCGCEIKIEEMQIDHVKSLYWHKGEDNISNFMPACRMCNFYKSTMPIEKFREQLKLIPLRMEKEFTYRLGKKYGLIKEKENNEILFYFETIN